MYPQSAKAIRRFRPSFTLVELLTAIAIIGIMAGMVLYTLAGAQRESNVARTRGTIQKLNEIILQRWEEFRYRAPKIKLPPEWLQPQAALNGQIPVSPREGARLRMIVLRDTMRMEMPDRMSDILYPPTRYKIAAFTYDNAMGNIVPDQPYPDPSNMPPLNREVPGQYNNFRQKIGLSVLPNPYPSGGPVMSIPASVSTSVNSAEWLYQIVASSNFEGGSGLEHFRPSEVDDVDTDGFPEFVDAWGNPIWWMRWPAGYPSPLNELGAPDAMDPLHTDWRWSMSSVPIKPWTLVPLIVSSGADGIFDLKFDDVNPVIIATQTWTGPTDSPAHAAGGPYYFPDPYATYSGALLGSLEDQDGDGSLEGAADNVSNYDLLLE